MTAFQRIKDNALALKTPTWNGVFHDSYRHQRRVCRFLVCTVGKTVLHYDARCIEHLHFMLKERGDWMELGGADEQMPAKEGTIEAWGRSAADPIGGWYGLKKGLRGRFGVYVPPLMDG